MKTEYIDKVPIYTYKCAYAINKSTGERLRVMKDIVNGVFGFSYYLFYSSSDEITDEEVDELRSKYPEYEFNTYMNTTVS